MPKKKSEGQQKLLETLTDFASIALKGKLSNLFLESFAQTVTMMERRGCNDLILRNLDVLIAILEQVKLNRSNQ